MNKDVERLDPALREVAARLKAAPQARVSPGFAQGVMAAVHSERVTARAGFFRRLNVGLPRKFREDGFQFGIKIVHSAPFALLFHLPPCSAVRRSPLSVISHFPFV